MDAVDLPHSDMGPHAGVPIVLLHGFPLDHRMWGPVQRELQKTHRVLVPDLRGFGQAPVKPDGSMEAHAADVLRMMDRVGARRFAVAGFSMGGYVALALARAAPERVAGLALLGTRPEADKPEAAAGREATARKVLDEGTKVLEDAMLGKLLTAAAPADAVALTRSMIAAVPPTGAAAALRGMGARRDQRDVLPALRVPTVVVHGTADALVPPEAGRAMADAVPGARFVAIEGGAHLVPLEFPREVADALAPWTANLR